MVSKLGALVLCAVALAVGIMLNIVACAITWPNHPPYVRFLCACVGGWVGG